MAARGRTPQPQQPLAKPTEVRKAAPPPEAPAKAAADAPPPAPPPPSGAAQSAQSSSAAPSGETQATAASSAAATQPANAAVSVQDVDVVAGSVVGTATKLDEAPNIGGQGNRVGGMQDIGDTTTLGAVPGKLADVMTTGFEDITSTKGPSGGGAAPTKDTGPARELREMGLDSSLFASGDLGSRQSGIDALRAYGDNRDFSGMSDSQIRTEVQARADAMHVEGTPHEGKTGSDLRDSLVADETNQLNGTGGTTDTSNDTGNDTDAEDVQTGGSAVAGEGAGQEAQPNDPNSAEAATSDTVAENQKLGQDDDAGGAAGNDDTGGGGGRGYARGTAAIEGNTSKVEDRLGIDLSLTPTYSLSDNNINDVHRKGDPIDGEHSASGALPVLNRETQTQTSTTDGTTQPVEGDTSPVDPGLLPAESSFDTYHGRPPGSDDGDDDPTSAAFDNGSSASISDGSSADDGGGDVPDGDGGPGGGGGEDY